MKPTSVRNATFFHDLIELGGVNQIGRSLGASKHTVQFARASDVCCVCFLWRVESSQIFATTVLSDGRTETPASILRHAFRVSPPTGTVAHVFAMACFTQIGPRIVQLPAVAMIHLILRPRSCHEQKRQTMRQIVAPIELDCSVSVLCSASRNMSRVSTVEGHITARSRMPRFPPKQSKAGTVVEKFFQSFLSEHEAIIQSLNGLRIIHERVGLKMRHLAEMGKTCAPAPATPLRVGSSPDPWPAPCTHEGSIGMRRAVGSDVRADDAPNVLRLLRNIPTITGNRAWGRIVCPRSIGRVRTILRARSGAKFSLCLFGEWMLSRKKCA